MTERNIGKLVARRRQLLAELGECRLIIRGTAFARYAVCSRPACPCHRGEKHGPRHYVAVTRVRRQSQHYVPVSQVKTVYAGVAQFHRVMAIISEITDLNLQLMQARALNQ